MCAIFRNPANSVSHPVERCFLKYRDSRSDSELQYSSILDSIHPHSEWGIGKCQNLKVSELESVRNHFLSILEEIGKCQNWKVSESIFCPFWKKLESVRIGKCQKPFLPILEEIGKCQNWKLSELESVRIRKCQNRKVSELESVRIGKCQNFQIL